VPFYLSCPADISTFLPFQDVASRVGAHHGNRTFFVFNKISQSKQCSRVYLALILYIFGQLVTFLNEIASCSNRIVASSKRKRNRCCDNLLFLFAKRHWQVHESKGRVTALVFVIPTFFSFFCGPLLLLVTLRKPTRHATAPSLLSAALPPLSSGRSARQALPQHPQHQQVLAVSWVHTCDWTISMLMHMTYQHEDEAKEGGWDSLRQCFLNSRDRGTLNLHAVSADQISNAVTKTGYKLQHTPRHDYASCR
jgi:hypothetical protein